jgi:hypothetical protein
MPALVKVPWKEGAAAAATRADASAIRIAKLSRRRPASRGYGRSVQGRRGMGASDHGHLEVIQSESGTSISLSRIGVQEWEIFWENVFPEVGAASLDLKGATIRPWAGQERPSRD